MLRRLLALCTILVLPVLAAVPALAHSPSAEYVSRTPLAKHHTAAHHAKRRAGKRSGKGKKQKNKRYHGKAKGHAKKKVSKSKTKSKTTRAAAKPRNTPVPTATPTNTPTPTDTPTPTATPIPTPGIAELQIALDMARGYTAAFTVCGLPQGVTAEFTDNPAYPVFDDTSPQGGVAKTTLTVIAPYTVTAGSYLLAVHPYFQDHAGNAVMDPPNGYALQLQSVLLTIDGSGNVTLAPSTDIAAVGNTGCSSLPPGFTASPTATPGASVAVSSAVSNPHPAAGAVETINGTLTVNGQPVSGVLMRSNWYLPNGAVASCDAQTDATGTASCSLTNDNPTPGFTVQIEVTFEYDGQPYTTYSSYTM